MKEILFLIILFNLCISFDYYSLKLNKIYHPQLININEANENITLNNITKGQFEELDEYNELQKKISEFNELNESYIETKNINSELYTIDSYIGYNKQYFRLLLSTFDDYTTIASKNCKTCNVSNKYNLTLSNNNTNISDVIYSLNGNDNEKFIIDSCLIPLQSKENVTNKNSNITVNNLVMKVLESNTIGFPNSDLIDGIISLSYNNNSQIPNSNFIMELYKEGKIESPSFSIIITSLNKNRLYLGDIMKNNFIKSYIDSSINKGECNIIDNKWQCQLEYLQYYDLRISESSFKKVSNSIVKFDLNENRIIIPVKYYFSVLIGTYLTKKSRIRRYNKHCFTYFGKTRCTCSGKNSFGLLTFYFSLNSKLDIDLRDYVYYNASADSFKCTVDVAFTEQDEFIIGLKGLNNTILSFNMEEKKISFFLVKKYVTDFLWDLILGIIFVIIIVAMALYKR